MADSRYTTLVESLETELAAQTRVVDFFERYYFGDHHLRYVTTKWQEVFGSQLSEMTSNWCQLVVDAAADRLHVEGFTFPSLRGQSEEGGPDDVAAEIWETNGLPTAQAQAHTTAIYAGRAYALVEPPEPGESVARVTVEHPAQTYVRMDPANGRRRLAAIKTWWDIADDGTPGDQNVTLYLPDRTFHLRRVRASGYLSPILIPRTGVETVDEQPNDLGVVPVIPLENRPVSLAAAPQLVGRRMLLGGVSDLQTVTPLQDAITKGLAELLILGEFASMPQRWATGIDIPTDPATGDELPRDEWASNIATLWTVKDKDARFGQFDAADGKGIIEKLGMLVRDIAATTRTPPHYLLAGMVNISGDALTAAETGLSERIKAKHLPLGGGWEQAMRIACGLQGDTARFRDRRCKTSWSNPEVRSEAQATDAALKLYSGRMLPLEMALERVPGMTQAKIERAVHLLGMPERGPLPSEQREIAAAAAAALENPPAPGGAPFDQDASAA